MNRRYLAIMVAVIALGMTAYLIIEHSSIATVGNYMRIWAGQFWELLVRLVVQFWELLVRGLELFWRFVPALIKNIVSTILTRPFGKFVAWFFAGMTLRYIVGPRVREVYDRTLSSVRSTGQRIGSAWRALPLWLRIVSIVLSAGTIAVVNVGLLLLPLGFFIEPIYRYIRNWIARESLERTSYSKRFNSWVYRTTRWLMRESPLFRKCLWPLRYRRLIAIRQARKLHYEYRKNGAGIRDMLGDLVKREEQKGKEDRPRPP